MPLLWLFHYRGGIWVVYELGAEHSPNLYLYTDAAHNLLLYNYKRYVHILSVSYLDPLKQTGVMKEVTCNADSEI